MMKNVAKANEMPARIKMIGSMLKEIFINVVSLQMFREKMA